MATVHLHQDDVPDTLALLGALLGNRSKLPDGYILSTTGTDVDWDLLALEAVVDAEHARFTDLWESLTSHQRLVLLAIAVDEGQGLYREQTRRRPRLGPAARVQKAVQRLVDRELVEPAGHEGYRVPDVLLRAWLRSVPQQHNLPSATLDAGPS